MTNKDDEVIVIDAEGREVQMGLTSDEKLLAMLIYVTSFFTTIIGPIIIWLLKREDSSFIDFHGKEYLNFVISYFVYGVVSAILMLVLVGFVLAPIVAVAGVIFTIIAAIKAFNGERYEIPLIFRIIK